MPLSTSHSFYDLAGRLLVSVTPNGVQQYNGSNFEAIDKTSYSYNAKGWLVAQEAADAGRTEYVYRKDGKIRFSQNAEQRGAQPQRFSYTHYDRSGRPVESGEYSGTVVFRSAAMTALLENTAADGGLADQGATKRDRTFTVYDSPDVNLPVARTQRFVHGAVASTRKEDLCQHRPGPGERRRRQ